MEAQHATARPTVRRISEVMGAEIGDVDIAASDLDAAMDTIRAAFHEHHLLVLRRQDVDASHIESFARRFGDVATQIFRNADGTPLSPVHSISNLDPAGKPSNSPYVQANYAWHTDHSFRTHPSLLTMLYGVELPEHGGDTEFADMTRAYDALAPERKRALEGVRVEHSYEYMRRTVTDRPASEEERRDAPPVVHPLVRTHPVTGCRSLYLGMYCARIIGMAEDEGRKLLDDLLAHATQPRFVYRHTWQTHDLLLWDNRCLLHRAIPNYDIAKHRRVLQRIVVKGSVPV
jgi:taurine dioxygenase